MKSVEEDVYIKLFAILRDTCFDNVSTCYRSISMRGMLEPILGSREKLLREIISKADI